MLAIVSSTTSRCELVSGVCGFTVHGECEETSLEEEGKENDRKSAKSIRHVPCLICYDGPWALNQERKELSGQLAGSGAEKEGNRIKGRSPAILNCPN